MSEDKEFKKCSAKKGGYADNICIHLGNAMQSSGKGIIGDMITNIKTGEIKGTAVKVKSGKYSKDGVLMNSCPFCRGDLHDQFN